MRHRYGCRKNRTLILLWCFTFSLFPLSALPKTPDSPAASSSIEVIPIEINEAHFQPPLDWSPISNSTLLAVHPMATLLAEELNKLKFRLSDKELTENLRTNETKWTLNGMRGELNQVDGFPMFRIVHEKTGLAILYIPDEVDKNSPHLKQIVARQHIDAGEADPKGRKPGRDTVVVRHQGLRVIGTEYHPRHPPGTPAWWGDYATSTYTAPQTGAYVLASYCAGLQVAAATCIGGIRVALGGGEFEYSPILLSALFASLIGAFASTYRVWTYRGSETSKILKMASVSLLYAYSLAIVRGNSTTLFSITDPEFLLLHATIHANTLLTQKGRVAWQKLAEMRDRLRYSSGHYDLAPFFEKWIPNLISVRDDKGHSTATISKASFFNQTLYLIPFSFKLVGLLGIGASVAIPLLGWKMDSGPLLLAASIPGALWVVSRYATQLKNNLQRRIELLKSSKEPIGDALPTLEQEHAALSQIETEIRGEFEEVWRDALYRPHRVLRGLSLLFVNSLEEVVHTQWPILKNTVDSAMDYCSRLLFTRRSP